MLFSARVACRAKPRTPRRLDDFIDIILRLYGKISEFERCHERLFWPGQDTSKNKIKRHVCSAVDLHLLLQDRHNIYHISCMHTLITPVRHPVK